MENNKILYGFLDLCLDDRFLIEEKKSIVASNPDVFMEGLWKDAYIIIATKIIMRLMLSRRTLLQNNKKEGE